MSQLDAKRIKVLHALLSARPQDTNEDIARTIGLSPSTVYRFLQEDRFLAEYKKRVLSMAELFRGSVMKALIEGAVRPGPGQSSLQRIYWEIVGELKKSADVQITLQENLDTDYLPLWVQKLLIVISQGGTLPASLLAEVETELDRALMFKEGVVEILPEYRLVTAAEEREKELENKDREHDEIIKGILMLRGESMELDMEAPAPTRKESDEIIRRVTLKGKISSKSPRKVPSDPRPVKLSVKSDTEHTSKNGKLHSVKRIKTATKKGKK